eukprot:jgi/Tetstr1/440120/TSEL_028478.t1
MPFSTAAAYAAQRMLMDITLAPFDALHLPTQTLLKTDFGRVTAVALVKRLPIPKPEPPPEPDPAEEEAPAEAEVQVPKPAAGKAAPKLATKGGKAAPAPEPELEPEPEAQEDQDAEGRLTDADKTGDMRSAWRALDEPLWLLVKDGYDMSGDASETWKLPMEDFVPGDNIRHTAERALNNAVSRSLDVFYELDSPSAHLPLADGGNAFFVRALLKGGRGGKPMDKVTLTLGAGLQDYAWVPQGDLAHYITDPGLLDVTRKLCALDGPHPKSSPAAAV